MSGRTSPSVPREYRRQVPVAGPMKYAIACLVLAAAAGARPASPHDLRERDVRFAGGGVELAGTLVLPTDEGPHPALAVTHGAEPASRRNAGYRRLAQRFAEQGVAVLIYDKRGVGDSEGEYVEGPDLRQPCLDLVGAVNFLRAQPEVDAERIGVWGASQGGWVAPMAASLTDAIAFVVIVSGPGVSPLEQNLWDKGNQLRARGVSDADVERATAFRRAFWTYLVDGEGLARVRELHAGIRDEPWFTEDAFPIPVAERAGLLRHPRLRHFAAHYAYDPRITLERVRCPLLAIFGASDTVVPVQESLARMRAAFAVAGNEDVTYQVHDGADHGIRVLRDGARVPAEGYHDRMVDWVCQQVF